jgi:hypothetical protein
LISGVILATFQWIYSPIVPSVNDWLFLSLYSLFPLIGALLYSISLAKLVASLTSTFESSANVMTIVLLLILREFGYRSIIFQGIFCIPKAYSIPSRPPIKSILLAIQGEESIMLMVGNFHVWMPVLISTP